jgi:hypothetical protein
MKSAAMTRIIGLDRGTFLGAIRTKYAAIARPGLKNSMAPGAFIEKHTGIHRHGFFPGMSALGAGYNGL